MPKMICYTPRWYGDGHEAYVMLDRIIHLSRDRDGYTIIHLADRVLESSDSLATLVKRVEAAGEEERFSEAFSKAIAEGK